MRNKEIPYAQAFYAISAYLTTGLSGWTWTQALNKDLWSDSLIYLIFYSAFLIPVVATFFSNSRMARVAAFLSIASLAQLLEQNLGWSHALWTIQAAFLAVLPIGRPEKYKEEALIRFGVAIYLSILSALTLWRASELDWAPLWLFYDAAALKQMTEVFPSTLNAALINYPAISIVLVLLLCLGFLSSPWFVLRKNGPYLVGSLCLAFAFISTYFFKDFRETFVLLTVPLFLLPWPGAVDSCVRGPKNLSL